MAKKKLNENEINQVVKMRKRKKTLKEIADKFNVHQSTISRLLAELGIETEYKIMQVNSMDRRTKFELRKVLLGFGISDPNILISELGTKFEIKARKNDEEFDVIEVR
jgi:arginine repressor